MIFIGHKALIIKKNFSGTADLTEHSQYEETRRKIILKMKYSVTMIIHINQACHPNSDVVKNDFTIDSKTMGNTNQEPVQS